MNRRTIWTISFGDLARLRRRRMLRVSDCLVADWRPPPWVFDGCPLWLWLVALAPPAAARTDNNDELLPEPVFAKRYLEAKGAIIGQCAAELAASRIPTAVYEHRLGKSWPWRNDVLILCAARRRRNNHLPLIARALAEAGLTVRSYAPGAEGQRLLPSDAAPPQAEIDWHLARRLRAEARRRAAEAPLPPDFKLGAYLLTTIKDGTKETARRPEEPPW